MNTFPYTPRKFQKELMETITRALDRRCNLVFEAPAGSGKTAAVLSSCMSFAKENDLSILYLTRTNSQQRQVISELKKIVANIQMRAVSIQGKAHMCLLIESLEGLKNAQMGNDEIARICTARKNQSLAAINNKKIINRCSFFERFLEKKDGADWGRVVAAEELRTYGKEHGICAYELNKQFARNADVIILPYIYVFDDFLRETFLSWYTRSFEDTILIVDEAHNLPDFCRELLSFSISLRTVIAAVSEIGEYNIVDENISALLVRLQTLFLQLNDTVAFSESNDIIVSEDLIEQALMTDTVDRKAIKHIAHRMVLSGTMVAEIREQNGQIPRSFLRGVGMFLVRWLELTNKWVRIVERDEQGVRIEAYCLDASIASSILASFYCSIHMSGTMQPLWEYKKSIGVDSELVAFPSPFPEKHRLIMYVEGISTKYYMTDTMVDTIARHIETICNGLDRNVLVLFPSYSILMRFLGRLTIARKQYVEQRGERQETIMKKLCQFKQEGGVFLSIMGGRLSEGIDFPSEELEVVVIVGIPYPPPSAKQISLQRYYEDTCGNGWKYVMEAQATRKILQSVGRLIRTENDRGVAVILDERATRFKFYIPIKKTQHALEDIQSFFDIEK